MASISTTIQRVLKKTIVSLITESRLGRLEYRLSTVGQRYDSWGGPMNGQTARLEIAREIIERCKIEAIVETGTFRGRTTEWFSQFCIPVFTAEISPRYASFSALRLQPFKNTRTYHGDSVSFLRNILEGQELDQRRVFVYLDAHWYESLPLREELEIIFNSNIRAVIMIDDFKVEFDAGYGYDAYGERELTMGYIQDRLPENVGAFFPSVGSAFETGRKRGCVVITAERDLLQPIETITLLKPAQSSTTQRIAASAKPPN